MHEFDFIARYMRPLAGGYADALGLRDDAAVMCVPEGMELVLTKDVMHEGVHFFGYEPARSIAKKLLRTNLSDLAAMGAKPYGYLLGLGLPAHIGQNWLADFAAGLQEDNTYYGVHVLGGDTSRTKSHVSLSLTALGFVPHGSALTRSRAKLGDKLYLSGTLGDSVLGLRVMRGELQILEASHQAYLKDRYVLPRPRIFMGQELLGKASSAMDISDGLLQDAGHLARASGVKLVIHQEKIPLSQAAKAVLALEGDAAWQTIVAGGDDYELLVTLPADTFVPQGLTLIGEVVAGEGVDIQDVHACHLHYARVGYTHF